MKEVNQLDEAEKILEIPISYEERGMKKGLEQGLEQGIEKGIRKVALEMLKEGIPLGTVIRITKLDMEEIEKMKKSL